MFSVIKLVLKQEVCLPPWLYYFQCVILSPGQDSVASEKSLTERFHDIQPECIFFSVSLFLFASLQQAWVIILLSLGNIYLVS